MRTVSTELVTEPSKVRAAVQPHPEYVEREVGRGGSVPAGPVGIDQHRTVSGPRSKNGTHFQMEQGEFNVYKSVGTVAAMPHRRRQRVWAAKTLTQLNRRAGAGGAYA
jgi:hypothetical protein